jgi:hypothetical protein
MGYLSMNDEKRPGPSEQTQAEKPPEQEGEPKNPYGFLPYAERPFQEELYAYRAEMAPVEPEPDPETEKAQPKAKAKPTPIPTNTYIFAGAGVVCLILIVVAIRQFVDQDAPAPYVDLGSSKVEAAGLRGRLIARWVDKAEYELYIDPLTSTQADGFAAVTGNPPHPLSFTIRLKDSHGDEVCQKEILIPFTPQQEPDSDQVQAPVQQKTLTGDTVQSVDGENSQIAEIVAQGDLPCRIKSYRRIMGWELATNFPVLADQGEWAGQEQERVATIRRRAAANSAKGQTARIRSLPAPIDGDDVIVGDNPTNGTVQTSGGRTFLVGGAGVRARAPGWQVFPAAIHFHCDKNAFCVLTRPDASTALQARLMK